MPWREYKTEAEWLAAKRQYLGCSELGAALGVDQFNGPLGVWGKKAMDIETREHQLIRYGRYMEPFTSDEYTRATGRPMRNPGDYVLKVHDDIPWLAATLDREQEGSDTHPALGDGEGVAELKALRRGKADSWPKSYELQLQGQMACTGASWGSLVAWVGGQQLVWKDFLRDEAQFEWILPRLEIFWWHVQNKVPPPDVSPKSLPAAKEIWAQSDGSTVDMDDEKSLDIVSRWEVAQDRKKHWTDRRASLELQVRAKLGDASFGNLGDGTYIKKREINSTPPRTQIVRWQP
jgi:predicted phage-related endonuclease